MAKFRATLRVLDLTADDPAAAQRALEARLKEAGLAKHRILSIENEAVVRRRRTLQRAAQPVPARPPVPRSDAGGLLLVTAIAWVVFMFYYYVLE